MIKGIYSAASGMLALEARQAAIAHNVANVSTPGFKGSQPVQLGFYDVFLRSARNPFHYNIEPAPGGGVKMLETYPNLSAGPLRTTDNPLDIALSGPGYLAVETPDGAKYTRDGSLTIGTDGALATQSGARVLSDTGAPLDVRGGQVNISQEGQVTVDNVPVGRMRLVEFESPERLMRTENNLLTASEEVSRQSVPATETTVHQQMLEMSNVNISEQMTQMILGMRAYEANQRVMVTLDESMGKLIEQVGMPR